jgi:glycosyltransferase involved in cell wall biosynthesis
MEALACGIPVLTYATGGSAEIIDEFSGSSVRPGDIDTLKKEIIRICETKPYKKEACLNRASSFNMTDKFKEYIRLYEEMLG